MVTRADDARNSRICDSGKPNLMDQRVQAAIAFMNANLCRKLSATEIARAAGISPSRLRHLFKDDIGKSLTSYRRNLQLERAKDLLETTELSVKEIAAAVGINTVSHFVQDFEKSYGLSPARYAERHSQTKASTTNQPSHNRYGATGSHE